MSFILLGEAGAPAVLGSGWRIPAADVRRLPDALGLAAELRTLRDRAQGDLDAAREEAREQGRREGREEGRREAAEAVAAQAASLSRDVGGELSALRARLGALSLDVVRRVAGEFGTQATVEAVAERAVREVLSDAPLVVRVAPEASAGVGHRLAAFSESVEVAPDPSLAGGDCVVVSRRGAAHAGLEVQLAALHRAFAEMTP